MLKNSWFSRKFRNRKKIKIFENLENISENFHWKSYWKSQISHTIYYISSINGYMRPEFSRDFSNRRSTGTNAYCHWVISTSIFKKSWKSLRNSNVPIHGLICLHPVLRHFWRFFFEKNCIELFLEKILGSNYRIYESSNLRRRHKFNKYNTFSIAILHAVIEDKPAQPLPCGSYLVYFFRCYHSKELPVLIDI